MNYVTVVGAGLAGCEAAYQISMRGVPVKLIEMKPHVYSPAHRSPLFAELVCSNSLKAMRLESASGLLKEEMRRLGSVIMAAADETGVPAGGALAVDRDAFSARVTELVSARDNIFVERHEALEVPDGFCVIATGPLTSDTFACAISRKTGAEYLNFYDAAAPIVEAGSIDMDKAFFAARYGRGGADYINCPMTRTEYDSFYKALIGAETAEVHGFEKGMIFEGCMPVEVMAGRGKETLLFGPLKPVGLHDPRTGEVPYAVVQLRRDNTAGSLYNMVGFQTHLKFGEQKRVFSMIPALAGARFARYGVMHRNTYLDSPNLLDRYYRLRRDPRVFFAGQLTGVEGYIESASSGLLAGINCARAAKGIPPAGFDTRTAIGALPCYISGGSQGKFQPMNINYGIIEPLGSRVKDKREKYALIAERSLGIIDGMSRNV